MEQLINLFTQGLNSFLESFNFESGSLLYNIFRTLCNKYLVTIISFLVAPLVTLVNMIISVISAFIFICVGWFVNIVIENFSLANNIFDSYKFTSILYDKMQVIGFSMFILIIVFQLFKSMTNYLGFEAEEPWKIGLKAIMFGFFIFFAKDICLICLDIFSRYMGQFSGIAHNIILTPLLGKPINPDPGLTDIIEVSNNFYSSRFFGNANVLGTLSIIMDIYISIKFFVLAFEFAERRMTGIFLIIVSPLAFACGVSKPTKQVLQGWCKAFAGNLIVQLFQYALFCGLSYFWMFEYKGSSDIIGHIVCVITAYSLIRVLDRLEEFLRDAGLSVGAALGPLTGPMGILSQIGSVNYGVHSLSEFFGSAGAGAPPPPGGAPAPVNRGAV